MKRLATSVLTCLLVLLLICGGMLGCGKKGEVETITIKVSSDMPEGHLKTQALFKMAELADSLTDGRLKFDIYHSGSLYTATEALEAVRRDDIQMTLLSPVYLVSYEPSLNIMNVLWDWTSRDHLRRFYTADDGGKRLASVLELDGFKVCGWYGGDLYAAIAAKKPLLTPSDYVGLKIRSLGSMNPLFQALGASPITVSYADLVTALQGGMVDAFLSGPEAIISGGFVEFAHSVTLFISGGSNVVICNLNFWNSLPTDIQDIMETQVIPEVVDWSWKAFDDAGNKSSDDLQAAGATVYLMSAEQKAAIALTCKTQIDTLKAKVDPAIVAAFETAKG